jgi:hypothetical protein
MDKLVASTSTPNVKGLARTRAGEKGWRVGCNRAEVAMSPARSLFSTLKSVNHAVSYAA